MCVLPYKCRKILEMLLKLMKLCEMMVMGRNNGAQGNEAWRAHAKGGPPVRIIGDGRGKRSSNATSARELGLLEARVDTWLMTLRFGKPYPVVAEHLDAFLCSE